MGLVLITAHDEDTPGLFGQAGEGFVHNLLYFRRKDFIGFKVTILPDNSQAYIRAISSEASCRIC
mgnify:CR=1 FL=1